MPGERALPFRCRPRRHDSRAQPDLWLHGFPGSFGRYPNAADRFHIFQSLTAVLFFFPKEHNFGAKLIVIYTCILPRYRSTITVIGLGLDINNAI